MKNNDQKWKVILLNIITFGYFNHYLKKKIKDSDNQIEGKIKVSNKIPFNVDKLISFLGGCNNIQNVEASLNTIQVVFVKKELINLDEIKVLGAKGTIINNNKLSIVFGDYANVLKEEIAKKIKE